MCLTRLAQNKKPYVWAHIKQANPALSELLSSTEFKQFKQQLERYVGPTTIGVDLRDIGGSLYGVCR
ncbi:hypothetical protein HW45_06965 [Vibrio sp. ER1A]|nr:hypothetical protein HW45_06965 [Vibrio sp. ER1A]